MSGLTCQACSAFMLTIMLLGLNRHLVAPNRVLTGSPGRKSRAGTAGGVGLVPNIEKWTDIFGDPAGSGRVLAGFSAVFRNGLKWSWKASGLLVGGPGVGFGTNYLFLGRGRFP